MTRAFESSILHPSNFDGNCAMFVNKDLEIFSICWIILLYFCPSFTFSYKPIVIDGQNVAVDHAKKSNNRKNFSSKGIQLVIEYFQNLGCEHIQVILPRQRLQKNKCDDQAILMKLRDDNILRTSPPGSYDDRYFPPFFSKLQHF